MGKNNAELTSITPFKENDCWYLKLIYKYKDKVGKHTVVIPKVAVPFGQRCVPYVHSQIPYFPNSQFVLEHPYINCSDSMPLYEVVSPFASKRGMKKTCLLF